MARTFSVYDNRMIPEPVLSATRITPAERFPIKNMKRPATAGILRPPPGAMRSNAPFLPPPSNGAASSKLAPTPFSTLPGFSTVPTRPSPASSSSLQAIKNDTKRDASTPRSQPYTPDSATLTRTVPNSTFDGMLPASVPASLFQRPATTAVTDEHIVIHVCDEARKIQRDFVCPRDLLLAEMKYFSSYLSPSEDSSGEGGGGLQKLEDVDISVHCDLHIFEWLMKYIRKAPHVELDTSNVVSILISSDFLQMESLVNESIRFVVQHLQEIIQQPVDLSCINSKLVEAIARMVSAETLDEIKDRKDKLSSRIYTKKVEQLLEELSSSQRALSKCAQCSQLFTAAQRSALVCPEAKIFIDFHGRVVSQHIADRNWHVNQFIQELVAAGVGWKEIYWRIWSICFDFDCTSCKQRFIGSDLFRCSYHPEIPLFTAGSNAGIYPCCQATAIRFDTSVKRHGCRYKSHIVRPEDSVTQSFQTLVKMLPVINQSLNVGSKQSILIGSKQQPMASFPAAASKVPTRLNSLVEPDHDSESDMDEDEDVEDDWGGDMSEDSRAESSSDEESADSDSPTGRTIRPVNGSLARKKAISKQEQVSRHDGRATAVSTAVTVNNESPPSSPSRKAKKKLTGSSIGSAAGISSESTQQLGSPSKKRFSWRRDIMRDQERQRMVELVRRLESMRTDTEDSVGRKVPADMRKASTPSVPAKPLLANSTGATDLSPYHAGGSRPSSAPASRRNRRIRL
eukprot:GILJ01013485.1.p1 GENE.GILJ01013485.1~~GILJ01013485.1.p1  ORF type:complete len:740 (+),score=117.42 GILJ01013485.1:42-2261(+)